MPGSTSVSSETLGTQEPKSTYTPTRRKLLSTGACGSIPHGFSQSLGRYLHKEDESLWHYERRHGIINVNSGYGLGASELFEENPKAEDGVYKLGEWKMQRVTGLYPRRLVQLALQVGVVASEALANEKASQYLQ